MNKLFMVISVDWVFLSHRMPIALEAKKRGFDVFIVTTDTGRKADIEACGLKVIDVKFDRSGKNPFNELVTIYTLWKLFRKNKPEIVHLVALKPCIYGSLAAKFAGIKNIINAITGLGYNFTRDKRSLFQTFLLKLLKYSLKYSRSHFIFQNEDDANFFIDLIHLRNRQFTLIRGCGVDLNVFSYHEEPKSKKIRFVLPARMLYDKGIVEFIKAANNIKKFAFGKAEFFLVGGLDLNNLAGITEGELNKYLVKDYIIWTGYSSDINSVLKNCHVVVLPSYREGFSKSLIEASAVGKPIITTDAPGCHDCVQDGINGFIVPVRDFEMMAEKMKILLEDKELRQKMGKKSREIAEQEFAESISVNATLDIYSKIITTY
jgi:glycosyltransferase involved in cell wall biosynthesis